MWSLTNPQRLGFGDGKKDQKHHVKIKIPRSSGLLDDGNKLKLRFEPHLIHKAQDESAGFDNIKIVSIGPSPP